RAERPGPPALGAARCAHRPWPPRVADPCRFRGQEPPDGPERARARATARTRRHRRGGGAPVRHLLSAKDLSRPEAITVLDTAASMAATQSRQVKKLPPLLGKTVVNLFFEDSTRTRISFEA